MPNRIIKESICTSESMNALSDFEENFFYKLIVNCDDYGCFDARPAILKARCYPLRDRLTLKVLHDALLQLASVGCVELYEVDGKPYLHIPSWEAHQQIRAKRRKFPEPDSNGYQMISDDCNSPRNPIQSESNPNPIQSESKKKLLSDFWEGIWKLYPKKEGKGQVSDTQKEKLFKIGKAEITRCVERYIREKAGVERQYLQNGSTFFNSGYVDYLDENYSESLGGPKNGDRDEHGRVFMDGKWVVV